MSATVPFNALKPAEDAADVAAEQELLVVLQAYPRARRPDELRLETQQNCREEWIGDQPDDDHQARSGVLERVATLDRQPA